MPASTTSFLFPDINVWVALTHAAHVHHDVARDWFTELPIDVRFSFCRLTQLGFLRLLTAEAVMGDEVLSQNEAWAIYDRSYLAAFADAAQLTLVTFDRGFRGTVGSLLLLADSLD